MIIKITFFIFCSALSIACQAGGPSIDGHGRGFLQRVRNTSAYPISFAQSKTILDYLPDGTIIRIKSLRKEYGVTGRYYAARRIVGAYRLEADTLDPEDLATHFVVKRFVARDFSEYIGIYSNSAEGKFMKSDESRAVTFSMPDMMDEKLAEGHWSIIPASGETGAIDSKKFMDPEFASNIFNNCYLKARASGVMQSRGVPQNYEGTNKAPINKSANGVLLGVEQQQTTQEDNEPSSSSAQTFTQKEPAKLDAQGNEIPKSYATAMGTPVTVSDEKSSAIGYGKTIVIINKRGMAMRAKVDGSWETLDQGINGASLTSIGAASDGTMWSCDTNNNVWTYNSPENLWNKVLFAPSTGVITKIVLANANQVWALSQDGTIFKKSGTTSNTIWKVPSEQVGTGVVKDFCITTDGTIFAICNDKKIYKGSPAGDSYTFTQFSSPQDLLNTQPYLITARSKDFVVFSTPSDEVYVLVSGKSGNTTDSWKKLTKKGTSVPIKLRSIMAQENNSIAGIVSASGQPEDNTVILINDITTT